MKSYICGELRADIDGKAQNEIDYLITWRADLARTVEAYGRENDNARTSRACIEYALRILDALNVPYWLQNVALSFAEDWRRVERGAETFDQYASRRGYSVVTA